MYWEDPYSFVVPPLLVSANHLPLPLPFWYQCFMFALLLLQQNVELQLC